MSLNALQHRLPGQKSKAFKAGFGYRPSSSPVSMPSAGLKKDALIRFLKDRMHVGAQNEISQYPFRVS